MLPENGHRLRLRPWIVEQINSGKYRGLDWLDSDKTEFKVPWKHAAKNDYDQEEDSKIFRAWSLHTGKYKVGIDKVEPAVWKTRLRTALNKLPDVEEVRDKKIRSPDGIPYRVYRLLPQRDHPWSRREEEDNDTDDTEEERVPSPKKRGGNLRKRRKSSHSSLDSNDSFAAMPTEIKKARKENDFTRIHFKKRDTYRSFAANAGTTKRPRSDSNIDRDNTSPQTHPIKTEQKVFPDTLPVTTSNGLMVTATIAANGLPVAMTVVPSSHTTTSSSSSVLNSCPYPGTVVDARINNSDRMHLDSRNVPQNLSTSFSTREDSKHGITNGHIQMKPLTDFKPPVIDSIPNTSPNETTSTRPITIKSEQMTTVAVPSYIQIPHIYSNSNGVLFTHPPMMSSLSQATPQLITVPSTFTGPAVSPTTIPATMATMPTLLPTIPSSVVTASTQTKDEKPTINNSMPKIESVVSLGMIAAKLRENHKYGYAETVDKTNFGVNVKQEEMGDEMRQRDMEEEEEEAQPIPLNYVMRHGFGAELNGEYREGSTPHSHEMLIEINYKSTKALKYQVNNAKGCHIYYVSPIIQEEAIEIEYGPLDADQVTFPNFNEFCMSEKQTKLTTTLLQHMDKGVLLYCKDGDVYLNRYGRTVIFWSTSQMEHHEPEKTKRGERVKIFDHQKFKADMRNYLYNAGPYPATPKIYLGVGQQWSAKCPLKNNLVSIMVTPLTAMEEYISLPTR